MKRRTKNGLNDEYHPISLVGEPGYWMAFDRVSVFSWVQTIFVVGGQKMKKETY